MPLISLIALTAGLLASTLPGMAPSTKAIALTSNDLPANTSFAPHYSSYTSPRQLNGDTVPAGVSVKQLRSAGFKGMYSQNLMRKNDDNSFGYPWVYVALPSAAAAHRVYTDWVAGTKKPFNSPLGAS